MLGNLHPLVQSSVWTKWKQTKISGFRHHEFWMDCALPRLLEVIKRVDVITINDEEARQLLENILC
jgi:hypothetical protein